MQIFLITFILSFVFSAVIVIIANKHGWFLNQHDFVGVQKFHQHPTPHIGGLAVFLSFAFANYLLPSEASMVLAPILLVAVPVFIVGLAEDFSTKISPLWRLIVVFISLSASFFYLGIGVDSLGFGWTDELLSYPLIGLAFTLLVVGGSVNSVNVIDGYNGLMAGYGILASLAMFFVAYQLGDVVIMQLNLLLIASMLGFFLLNFPLGKIFMGDGGAYFIGFMLSMIGLVFVERHAELSNWFVLLLLMYPMYELLYSIYRRRIINGTPASQPDGQHLHMLVYKQVSINNLQQSKVANNSKTSPYLWMLSLFSIIPAIFYYDNKLALIASACAFMLIYTGIYRYFNKH
ncbi:MAG: glycosyltransferase [Candidatus Thioglobus sp.]|nr:MAG: glycosyltransferase [Candidatus Thioglobus sp.]